MTDSDKVNGQKESTITMRDISLECPYYVFSMPSVLQVQILQELIPSSTRRNSVHSPEFNCTSRTPEAQEVDRVHLLHRQQRKSAHSMLEALEVREAHIVRSPKWKCTSRTPEVLELDRLLERQRRKTEQSTLAVMGIREEHIVHSPQSKSTSSTPEVLQVHRLDDLHP